MSDEEFTRENRAHVRTLANGLVELEESADEETLAETFRAAHTLKGNLDMAGYDDGRALAHAVEDLLDAIRSGDRTPDPELIDAALDATDEIGSLIAEPPGDADSETAAELAGELRDRLDAGDAGSGSEPAPEDAGEAPDSGAGLDFEAMEAEPDEELSAEEALASVDGLDDLDALVEGMDDDEDDLPDLDEGGVFSEADDSRDGRDVVPEADDPGDGDEEAGEVTPAESAGGVDNEGWDEFQDLQSEHEPGETDVESLQDELEEVEFGEFDEEDTMSISELAESVEPGEEAPAEEVAEAADDTPAVPDATDDTPAASDATTDTPPVSDDVPGEEAASPDIEAESPGGAETEVDASPAPDAADASASGELDADAGAANSSGRATPEAGTADDLSSLFDAGDAATGERGAGEAATGAGSFGEGEFATDVEAFEDRFGDVFEGEGPDPGAVRADEQVVATLDRSEFGATAAGSAGTGADPVTTPIDSLTVDIGAADELLDLVEDLSLARARLVGATDESDRREAAATLGRALSDLRETVFEVRLMPFSTVTDDLPRIVRDAANETGREVDLEVSGTSVTLDRGVISRLKEPLVHLVRNAVAHGIEPPEEREEAGKDPTGSVEVHATRSADHATIEVIDDGQGIDADAVRERAVESGIVTEEEARAMDDREARQLVFEPGFSTAEAVTELSGRGVGMNAVEEAIDELGGEIEIESDPGFGTAVRVEIPIAAAMDTLLFVTAGDEEYAVPTSAIERVSRVDASETTEELPAPHAADASAIADAGGTGSEEDPDDRERIDLAAAMGAPGRSGDPGVEIRIRPDVRPVVLLCDAIGDVREVVVHPFAGPITERTGLSGSVLREDSLVHLIDVETI